MGDIAERFLGVCLFYIYNNWNIAFSNVSIEIGGVI